MRLGSLLSTIGLATATASATPTTPNSTNTPTSYVGPENGHLVIVGGNLQSSRIWQKIIDLSGGPNASIIVIPTAGGEETYNDTFPAAVTLRELGAKNVQVLHTYDPETADTEEFIAPLKTARGIYFGGGRQWRLVDAYAGTKAEIAFQSVLDREGVISGSSAGASIMGSFLARGDTKNNQIMIGDHTVGFGYLNNSAIDQHVLVRNRHFDMFDILKVYPELLGLAIDEDTAVIVNKNVAEVFGSTYALIYDRGFWSRDELSEEDPKTLPPPENRFYFLKQGDKYDLGLRKVIEEESASTGD
ncbi:Cyanophycinase [Pseudocercospora fuligena]|uniref:Cyanophycinase n=1 Tax=Pseudocercospora fuligena TaxID=685502 RepID=A0A8H6RNG7_9PEZI|nr:Cyanophycinase [Pseudocercospora fuligena]